MDGLTDQLEQPEGRKQTFERLAQQITQQSCEKLTALSEKFTEPIETTSSGNTESPSDSSEFLSEQQARIIARLLDDPYTEQRGFDHFRNFAYEIDGKLKFTTKEQQRRLEAIARQVNQYARETVVQVAPTGWWSNSRTIEASPRAMAR